MNQVDIGKYAFLVQGKYLVIIEYDDTGFDVDKNQIELAREKISETYQIEKWEVMDGEAWGGEEISRGYLIKKWNDPSVKEEREHEKGAV